MAFIYRLRPGSEVLRDIQPWPAPFRGFPPSASFSEQTHCFLFIPQCTYCSAGTDVCLRAAALQSVFSLCVCTCRRGLAGDLALSECICGESSSHRGSGGMRLHVLRHMVGFARLQATRGTRVLYSCRGAPCQPRLGLKVRGQHDRILNVSI